MEGVDLGLADDVGDVGEVVPEASVEEEMEREMGSRIRRLGGGGRAATGPGTNGTGSGRRGGRTQTRIAGFPMSMPATYESGERSAQPSDYVERASDEHVPPLALMLPRRGTTGTRPLRMHSVIFSTRDQRTPECPRIRELARISIAARVHGTGMVDP